MTSKSKTSKTVAPVTEATKVATTLEACREALEQSCKAFSKVAAETASLNEKRVGSYTLTIRAAIAAGTVKDFTDVYAGLQSDVAANVAGIARKLGCKLGKANKEGKASYVMPGSLMVAVSVVKGAMEYGIALTDKEGEPRTFGEIRKAKSEADAKAREATETPLQYAQRQVRELAAKIAEGADALTVTEAQDCAKILRSLIAVESGAKPVPVAKAA